MQICYSPPPPLGLMGRARWDLNPFVSDFSQQVRHMCTQSINPVRREHIFPSYSSSLLTSQEFLPPPPPPYSPLKSSHFSFALLFHKIRSTLN